jgi:hypothetical protein
MHFRYFIFGTLLSCGSINGPTFGQAVRAKQAQAPQTDVYPVPVPNPDMLFYLQRSLDVNTVIYEANYSARSAGRSQLDSDEPVNIYWIKYDKGGMTAPLSQIQRLGYGVRTEQMDSQTTKLQLVAYRKMPIILKHSIQSGRYHAHISVKGKDVVLSKVFINIDGGTKLKPNVTYIELTGNYAENGDKVIERLYP